MIIEQFSTDTPRKTFIFFLSFRQVFAVLTIHSLQQQQKNKKKLKLQTLSLLKILSNFVKNKAISTTMEL